MDVLKMIAELRSEKAAIEETIILLERIAGSRGKRRGRPPSFMTRQTGFRQRKPFSEETRKRMAAAQSKRWAAYRKAQKST
jgi:hypothetical protein